MRIVKINKERMKLSQAYNYIIDNEPKKEDLKNTDAKDFYDDNKNHKRREYYTINKEDIVNTFIIDREMIDDNTDNDVFYLTHIYNNPHQNLELEDEEIF